MREPNQVLMFNSEELSLLKNTFADNDALLYAVRKVLHQFPLTDAEKNLIKLSITPEVIRVLRKKMLPEISDEFPLGQLPSLVTTLKEQMGIRTFEEMAPLFSAKATEIEYLEQQFAVLADLNSPEPLRLKDFAILKDRSPEEAYVGVTAYLFLVGYIDPALFQIKMLAGSKSETPEQQAKRITRDSSKLVWTSRLT